MSASNRLTNQPPSCSSQPTNVPLHATKWKWPLQQQPSTAPPHCTSQWPHQMCIINTAVRERWWISVRATLDLFSNPSLSGTLLEGLASPTLPQLHGSAQLRCNNPNSHSLQFPHFCLHTHLPYVHNHLCRRLFPFLEDQRHRNASRGWGKEGFYPHGPTHCWGEALHLHIIISDVIVVAFCIIP